MAHRRWLMDNELWLRMVAASGLEIMPEAIEHGLQAMGRGAIAIGHTPRATRHRPFGSRP